MSVRYDITAESLAAAGFRVLHAGNDWEHDFVLTGVDLTSAKVWFTIKEDPIVSDAQAKLQLDSSDTTEIEITDAANGKLTVKFKAADTAGIAGLWEYDMKAKLASGKTNTYLRGVIEFLPLITRATT